MKNFRLSIEKSEEMSFGCLVDQNDRLVASSFGSNSRILEERLEEYSARSGGKSPTRINHWLTEEIIRRFEGAKNSKNAKLNRSIISTNQSKVRDVLDKIHA